VIERVIAWSIRNRWLVVAAGLLLALAGLYAVYQTPVDAIPDLSENQAIVYTEWPGHSPPEIEAQVTYPLSLHLQGLEGVRVVRSSSDFNFSMLSIIFEDGVSFTAARERVSRRLTRAREGLPAGVVPALAPDAAATGQIYWYTVEGLNYELAWAATTANTPSPSIHAVCVPGACSCRKHWKRYPAATRRRVAM
jgi:Cu(I)/Ag(I) efflux system membrane protein CusA/SilA